MASVDFQILRCKVNKKNKTNLTLSCLLKIFNYLTSKAMREKQRLSKLYSRSQVLLEGGEEGLGNVDDFFTYINTVVAVDLTNLVEGDDEGAMDAHETIRGEHLFDRFHRKVSYQRLALALQIEHHVIFHA